jgi:replicative DNA helicase
MTDLHKIAAPDAEAAFLGAMLADPDQIDAMVAEGLAAHDFAVHLHRRAWTALVALRASDTPVDEVTLWQEMESTGATRPEWLHDLASWSSLAGAMPTHAAYHAGVIKTKRRLRELHLAALDLAQGCATPGADPATLGEKLSVALEEATPPRRSEQDFKSVLREVFERIQRRSLLEAAEGMPTGLREVDALIGGLEATRLYILSARPGMGKTALMLQLVLAAARRGPVYVASLEMTSTDLGERALALEARVDAGRVRESWTLDQRGFESLRRALIRMKGLPIFIDDASNVTPAELRARVRAFSRKHGAPALVAVDYLQRLASPDVGTANRAERVGAGSWACKAIAKNHNCPVLLLCQLNRDCEKRTDKRPVLSDMKESGDIEQDADVVFGLYREGYYDAEAEDDLAEIIVLKNRHGRPGRARARWVGSQTRFEDLGDMYQ